MVGTGAGLQLESYKTPPTLTVVPGAGQQKSACSPGRALSTASQWSDQMSASMRTYGLVAEHVRWQKHACVVGVFECSCTYECAARG